MIFVCIVLLNLGASATANGSQGTVNTGRQELGPWKRRSKKKSYLLKASCKPPSSFLAQCSIHKSFFTFFLPPKILWILFQSLPGQRMGSECTDLACYKYTNLDYISEPSLPSIQHFGETEVHSFCENLFKDLFTATHGKCYISGHVWEKKDCNWTQECLTDCQIVTGLCTSPKLHIFCREQETTATPSSFALWPDTAEWRQILACSW